MSGDQQRQIVIIGGGIIGCTSAYYLSRHPSASRSTITLLEASMKGAAQGASGKAGGLVAKWAYPRALVDLSFNEHIKLAEEHDGTNRWGWRHTACGSWIGRGESAGIAGERVSLEKTKGRKADGVVGGLPSTLDWIWPEQTDGYDEMAPEGHTAQVHPYQFTTSMLELAQEKGVEVLQGKVTSISTSHDGQVTGVSYSSADGSLHELPATDVVLAAGAWSPSLVPTLHIGRLRAHSITIRTSNPLAAYALFTELTMPGKRVVKPEIYARPHNEAYVCGEGDSTPLPPTVDEVQVDSKVCEALWEQSQAISHVLSQGKVENKQACYLPTGGPFVGAMPGYKGLVVAAGHTCWGICNGPGTGRAVSELVMDGKVTCAHLTGLKPR